MSPAPSAVHIYHNPTGARLFAAPMVRRLGDAGIATELWCDGSPCSWFGSTMNEQPPGVPVRHLPSTLSWNPLRSLIRLARLCSAMRKTRPQAVHAHLLRGALLPLLAARLAGIPRRIYHNHGLSHLGYRGAVRFLLLLLERLNRAQATHVLMVSESNRDAALAEGLHRPAMTVLAHGTAVGIRMSAFDDQHCGSAARIRQRGLLDIAADAPVIGYAGRAAVHKGLDVVCQAWSLTGLADQGGVLLLAGVSTQELERLCYNIPRGVRCLGPLRDMPPFYAACDLIVQASRYEGFGYSLLEAAAAGLPTVGSDVPGIRCAIADGQTGMLVPTGDVRGFAAAFLALAGNPQRRQELGSNARRRTSERFSEDLVLTALVAFYRDLLGLDPHQPALRETT